MKKIKHLLSLGLRFIITFGILFFLFKKTDFVKLKEIFKNLSLPFYLTALFCFNSFQLLVALRWQKICKSWGFKQSYLFFLKSYLMGFSLNTVMPGIVGGDLLRSFLLTQQGLPFKKATFSVMIDRFYGLLGIFFILSISLPLYGQFLPERLYYFSTFTTYSIILGFFLVSLFFTKVYSKEYFNPVCLPYNLFPIILGVLIQILFVLQFVLLGKALHLNISYVYYFVMIPIISFLAALPISISGLGVREGSLSYFVSLLGFSIEHGVLLGMLGYSLILISALPGLYFYLKAKISWK
ncbi:lysylphosphatidylglycerol synthase transmembrane domain-containing protein [Thermodesulfobacterium hveragerdense]|uniref:lysylphosphatidylglycerol synthase transmembrane domain-containing protein n=1 Tax=Thermodesulfobacterium hveragerdense TaxID=53424 RepID=UPI00041428A5|nr:lysylphosphatidylglycerol synthase transmembrane domain-containing protein [Thermodesulfobacterium hveragerdense]